MAAAWRIDHAAEAIVNLLPVSFLQPADISDALVQLSA